MLVEDGIRQYQVDQTDKYFTPVVLAIITSLVAGLVIGTFLLQRCASGALGTPLPRIQLIAMVAVLTVWAVIVRIVLWKMQQRAVAFSPLIVLLLFAVACSYPGNRLIDWTAWLLSTCAMLVPARVVRKLLQRVHVRTAVTKEDHTVAENAHVDPLIVQKFTRHRAADGSESIRGTMTADFVIGQRSATLFVAFCPPFARLPTVEAHVTDDWPAEVKVTQRLHHGAQLEVRLTEPAEDEFRLQVEMYAAETNTN